MNPKKPECRPIYVCTKDGQIFYVTIDWDEALRYKNAFGCTIWQALVDNFIPMPNGKEREREITDFMSIGREQKEGSKS